MIPWEQLDTAPIPDSEGTLRLMRRGSEYSIMTGGTELMNSRLSGSEKSLAALACAKIAGRAAPTVLIGGLGMGFTLRAALDALPSDASVIVAEIVPQVVDWARGPLAPLFGDCLDDPRVTIRLGDVAAPIREADGSFDAMLLDVDNGPGGLDRAANDDLYGAEGLLMMPWTAPHPGRRLAAAVMEERHGRGGHGGIGHRQVGVSGPRSRCCRPGGRAAQVHASEADPVL